MKAKLNLHNIANILGNDTYEFNSGKLTILRGQNGSGKTKIINSIAVIESFPINTDRLFDEALKFGIGDTLINNTVNNAEINLSWEKINKKLLLNKKSEFKINLDGNENFLYTSLLHPKSRLRETILEKNPDFSWILKELSLAKYFDIIIDIIKSYLEQCDIYLNEINNNEEDVSNDQSKLKEKRKKKNNLNSEINKINKEINLLKEVDPEKVKEYNDLGKKIKNYLEEIENNKKEINSAEKDITKPQSQIALIQNLIDDKQQNLKELGKKQRELKKINKDAIQAEIIRLMEDEKEHFVPKNNLEKKILSLENKIKVKSDTCPLCDRIWEFDPKKLKSELDENKIKLRELNPILNKISKEIKSKKDRIKEKDKLLEVKENYKRLYRENVQQQVKIDKLTQDIDQIKKRVKSFIEVNNETISKQKMCSQKYKELEQEISSNKEFKILADKKSKIDKELGAIIQQEKELNLKIKNHSEIQLWGINFNNFINARDVLIKLKNDLEDISKNVKEKSNYQKQGVAIKFNEKIENLLQKMDFSSFEKVMFDLEDYQLKIYTKGLIAQNVKSLSDAEKIVILSLLQISLKETYTIDSPFFLVDEVIHSLDERRKPIFLDYLKKLAEKNDWFIILTELYENKLEILEY